MIYSANSLQTVADCDEMINMANGNKSVLVFKQTELVFIKTRYQANTMEVEQEMVIALAELASTNAILPTLPDGSTKKKYHLNEQRKQETRVYQLENKKASYGTLALLTKELEQSSVEHELADLEDFIAAVTIRKGELS